MEHGGLSGYVDDLFVRPSFRRRGVASGLLRESFRIAVHEAARLSRSKSAARTWQRVPCTRSSGSSRFRMVGSCLPVRSRMHANPSIERCVAQRARQSEPHGAAHHSASSLVEQIQVDVLAHLVVPSRARMDAVAAIERRVESGRGCRGRAPPCRSPAPRRTALACGSTGSPRCGSPSWSVFHPCVRPRGCDVVARDDGGAVDLHAAAP